eukprot:2765074-Amphidinium_carterae.1
MLRQESQGPRPLAACCRSACAGTTFCCTSMQSRLAETLHQLRNLSLQERTGVVHNARSLQAAGFVGAPTTSHP